jgi:MFS family permease
MQLTNAFKQQASHLRGLNRNAWLFLLITFIHAILFAGWDLYFNFFILARGFDREFLGLARGATPAAGLIFGLVMGLLSDKIGRKRAMIFGEIGFLSGFVISLFTLNPTMILLSLFLAGVSDSLFVVSQLPLLSKLAGKDNKSFLFSLNFGLATFSGMLGSFLAGQAPGWYEAIFGQAIGSVENYQLILLSVVGLAYLALIPMILIRLPNGGDKPEHEIHPEDGTRITGRSRLMRVLTTPMTWKIFFPNLLVGTGAALLVPFLNLFLVDRFNVSEVTLGTLFSLAGLLTAIGSLLAPTLEKIFGSRVKAVVLAQGSSLVFLLLMGFAPTLSLAAVGFLMRGALMNMGVPLWDSFVMDHVPETRQGTITSMMFISWQLGWTIGPSISGYVQENIGFTPLFIATTILYGVAISLTWSFFGKTEEKTFREPAVAPAGS